MTRRKLGVFTLLLSLVLCGAALAATPAEQQYGNPIDEPASSIDEPPARSDGPLPFTGLQIVLLLASGAGLTVSGLTLRRVGRGQELDETPPEPDEPADDELLDLFLPLAARASSRAPAALEAPASAAVHCGTCGIEYDPRRYQIVAPELGESFHSIDCATRARREHGRMLARRALDPGNRPSNCLP